VKNLFKRRVLAYTLVLVLCLTQIPLFISSSEADDKPNYELQYLTQEDYVGNESGWPYSRSITINHEFIDEQLSDFPILISYTSNDFSDFAQSDGDDFVFTNSSGETVYNHEIEKFDSLTGELVVWVNVTTIEPDSDTVVVVHYGNGTCGSQENPNNVWDGNYLSVWHMADYHDSSYPHYNLTTNNTDPEVNTSGIAGNCYWFDAKSDALIIPDDNVWTYYDGEGETGSTLTYEVWLHRPSLVYPNTYIHFFGDYDGPYFQLRNNNRFYTYIGNTSGRTSDTVNSFNTEEFFYCVLRIFDDTTEFYLNTTYVGGGTSNTSDRNPNNFWIGENERDEGLHGNLDEIRISSIVRNHSWINATYNSINQTDGFISVGPQSGFDESDWSCWDSFTIESDFITEDLTGFPFLIEETHESFSAFAQDDGDDFVFTNATNETVYSHEIESYNSSSGNLIAWVNITELSSSEDTVVNLHYGNPYCGSRQNVEGTWDCNYTLVLHMNETSGAAFDSSIYGNDAYVVDIVNQDSVGKIGKANDFDGVSGHLHINDTYTLDLNASGTLECWFFPDTVKQYFGLMHKGDYKNWSDESYSLQGANTLNNIRSYLYPNSYNYVGGSVTDGEWFHGCSRWGAFGVKLYLNSIEGFYTSNASNARNTYGGLNIGTQLEQNHSVTWGYFAHDGRIDELRISNIDRNESWINATYDSTNKTTGFVSFNSEDGFDESMFAYNVVITIDHNYIDEDLTNFPILLNTSNTDYMMAQSDGADFAFSNPENTSIYNHEIELFNDTTGEIAIWVNITHLDASADTVIIMHYGNTTCNSFENPHGVWDEHYIAVWHMDGSSATTVADSTTNNFDSVENLSTSIAGRIGLCREYNLTTHDRFTNSTVFEPSNFTCSLWIRPYTAADAAPYVVGKKDSWATQLFQGTYYFSMDGGDDPDDFDTDVSHSENAGWDYLVWTFRTDDGYDVYINGTLGQTLNSDGAKKDYGSENGVLTFGNVYIDGWHSGSSWRYSGLIDEVRVSNIERNSSWINASFNNQNQTDDFITFGEQSGFDNTQFDYWKVITINHDYIDEDLSDFPVLVHESNTKFINNVQSDGDDFAFSNLANDTQYDHEIELYNSTSGKVWAWVKIPTVSSTVDTQFIMHYGNDNCGSQENTEDVWDENYVLVLHMNETSGGSFDSSIYGNDAYVKNVVNQSVIGKIGLSNEFDGINGHLHINDTSSLELGGNGTLECWFNWDSELSFGGLIHKGDDSAFSDEAYGIYGYYDYHRLRAFLEGTPDVAVNSNYDELKNNSDIWYHGAFVWNESGARMLINGTQDASTGSTTITNDTSGGVNIGTQTDESDWDPMDGRIDEVRISNIGRTNAWMSAGFNNTNQTVGFMTIGPQNGFDEADFDYWKLITINHNYVEENLTNFPVLVHNVSAGFVSRVQPDGDDFAFSSVGNETQYDHEIEYYDNVSGELWSWVEIPYISSETDTEFIMHYGNQDCESNQNPEAVWDENYVLVLHVNETSGTSYDSTLNNNDAYVRNSVNQSVVGKIGGCAEFDGYTGHLVVYDDATLDLGDNGTLECWFYWDNDSYSCGMLHKGNLADWSDESYGLQHYGIGGDLACYASPRLLVGPSTIKENSWYYVAGAWDYLHSTLHYNSSLADVEAPADTPDTSGDINIGTQLNESEPERGYYPLDGRVDEIRISNIGRSGEWINTTFHTTNQTVGFMNFGAQQPADSLSPPSLSNEEPTNGTVDTSLYPWLNITVSDEDGDTFNITWITNESGSWEAFAWNSTVTDGTFRQKATWADGERRYHWGVKVNDSLQSWTNGTYWFSTQDYDWSNWSSWWTFTYTESCSPTNLSLENYSYSGMNITWDACYEGADTYVLVMNESGWSSYPGSPSNGTEVYNGTSTFYNHSDLASSTTYYYTIWGYNSTDNDYSFENDTGSAETGVSPFTMKWNSTHGITCFSEVISKDINGDGIHEIFLGGTTDYTDTIVFSLNGSTGQMLWMKNISSAQMPPSDTVPMVVCDLNNDNEYELVHVGGNNTYARHANNGTIFWNSTAASAWSHPVVVDADKNNYPYVYVCGMSTYFDSNDLYKLYGTNGTIAVTDTTYGGGSCMGGLSAADLESDGSVEIVICDGGSGFRVYDTDLNQLWKSHNHDGSSHCKVLANVTGNSSLEIIGLDQGTVDQYNGGIVVYYSNGSVVPGKNSSNLGLGCHAQPAVYDIDGDGNLEIGTAYSACPHIFDLETWSVDHNFTELTNTWQPPEFVNIMGDDNLEIIYPSPPTKVFNSTYVEVYDFPNMPAGDVIVTDIDDDGLSEMVMNVHGYTICYETLVSEKVPNARTDISFFSERRTCAEEYVSPVSGFQAEFSGVYPPNESVGNDRAPSNLSVQINGSGLDIYIYFQNMSGVSNSTELLGVWLDQSTNRFEITPLINSSLTTQFIWGDTVYFWYLNVTDGASWYNETYYFVTDGSRYDIDASGDVVATDASVTWSSRSGEKIYDGIYDVNSGGDITATDASIVWSNRT